MPESATAAPPPPLARRSYRWVAVPLLAFAVFALTAGLLAHHSPRSKGYFRRFFSDPIHLKAGLPTAAARSSGQVGPNLDQLRPTYEQVRAKVERGGGAMPSFAGTLSGRQIRDVAAFVASR